MSVRLAFPTTLLEMQHMFPDENAAAAYLRAVRWPDGLVCRFCGWKGTPYTFENRPTVCGAANASATRRSPPTP